MIDRLRTRRQLLEQLRESREQTEKLAREISQHDLEIAALLTASRSVSEFKSFSDAAHSIFDIARELTGATSGYVALVSEDGADVDVVFLDSGGLPCTVDPELPMPFRGLRGEVYASGRVAYENDFAGSPWQEFMPAGHVDLQNVMFAPLMLDDRVVGLMGLANKPDGFNDNDARLATVFGELAAVALANDYSVKSLERSEERFRSLAQSANDAIISADEKGRMVSWNNGARQIFGYEEAEVLGQDLTMLMPELYRDVHQRAMREFLQTGVPRVIGRTVEMHGLRKDGSEFPLELSLSYWKTMEGTFFTGIIRDITSRRRYEQLSDALNSIYGIIGSSLEIERIIDATMVEASRALGSGQAFVASSDAQGWSVSHVYGVAASYRGTLLNREEAALFDEAMAGGAPRVASPPAQASLDNIESMGLGSLLLIPLHAQDEVMGVLAVGYRESGRSLFPAELDFAGKLATVVSLSLKNAALFSDELESRSICQNYANQLSVLHDVGLSLNRETDKYKLLRTVLKAAAELTAAGFGIMTLTEEGKSTIVSSHYAPWNSQRCAVETDASSLHQRFSRLLADRETSTVRLDAGHAFEGLPAGHIGLRGLLAGVIRDTKGRARGLFMLSDKAEGSEFTSSDEEIISLLAAQSSVALVSAENFEREHVVAETLQDALLPEPPSRDDIDVGLLYQSAGQLGKVGGDFYDFIELDQGRIALVVGDVCGKGLAAATYTAMIKYMLRAYLGEGMHPGDCLTRLNHNIHNQVSIEKFVTVGLALIDNSSSQMYYSSAGHPPPVLTRRGKASLLLSEPAVPLGVIPDQKFLSTQAPVSPSDVLVMYTDGLLEARQSDDAPFGEQRILDCVDRNGDEASQSIAQALIDEAIEYAGGALRDDIALLVVRLTGNGR
ncbi:MAG: PAS domain S-box protein [Gaiellales bacterium]|nr:MAG: PAS domain S-box protein [Gaiellales bacterium]